MLDYLQAVALLGLIVCQYLLLRGCFSIKEGINTNGDSISGKIDRTADLLDEVAQLIADFTDGMGSSPPAVAQPPSGLGEMVAMFLNNRMNTAAEHATQEQSDWEVFPPNPNPPTNEAESQPQ